MSYLRPYSTLLIGVVLGAIILPKVASKVGVRIPGT